jgi:tight adherence protein B
LPVSAWLQWTISQLLAAGQTQGTLLVLLGVLVGLVVIFIFAALRQFIGTHSQTDDRMNAHVAMLRVEEEEAHDRRRRPGVASRMVMRLSLAGAIAVDLDRANVSISVPEFMLVAAGIGVVAFLAGLLRGSFILGIILAVLAMFVLRFWVHRRANQRRQAFARQLNDVINLVVGALRAGYGTVQAFSVVVREMPAPASDELGRVVREVQLGLRLSDALEHSAERLGTDDWSLITAAITIQAEVGGNLAEILQTVGETIRERVRILGEVRVLTTQQRLTGWLLSLMPIGLGVILYVIDPEYMSGLFTPGLPILLAIAGAAGILLGMLVIRRIVAIEV